MRRCGRTGRGGRIIKAPLRDGKVDEIDQHRRGSPALLPLPPLRDFCVSQRTPRHAGGDDIDEDGEGDADRGRRCKQRSGSGCIEQLKA